jgi:type II secretory pathway component PulF
MLFFRELGGLLESGTPVDEALETVAKIVRRGALPQVIATLRADIAAGVALHQAFAKHRSTFDEVELANLEAAATTGNIAPACTQLAKRIEVHSEVRNKLVSGLAYPALLAFSACFLLPLPLIVQESPAAFAKAAGGNVAIYIGVILAVLVGLPKLLKIPVIRRFYSTVADFLPGIGGLVRDRRFMLVYSTLASMLRAGVALPYAIELSARATGEEKVKSAAVEAVAKLQAGSGLADAVAVLPGISDEAVGLLLAGEKTGAIDAAAQRQADYHADRYRRGIGVLGQVFRFGVSLVVAGIVALSIGAQFSKILSNPLAMLPANQRKELERELNRAQPQVPQHNPPNVRRRTGK